MPFSSSTSYSRRSRSIERMRAPSKSAATASRIACGTRACGTGWRLDLDLTGNYTGRMLVQHMAGSGVERDTAVETPRFFDLNLRLGYTLQLYKEVQMELFGGVKNLFDAYQEDFDLGPERDSGYVYGPLLPRSWYLGLKVRF